MQHKSLVSISDYNKDEILAILDSAATFEENPNR
ncbi:MAG: aspartate carbamoyltransferase, partial [Paludibacter sp.]|nr:aspartate carbamoyltransferase [Paludibacter sp.]